METNTDAKEAPDTGKGFDYTGTPPFAKAAWKDNPTMCQWCAGTGHPHGNPKYGICKCPELRQLKGS